MTDSRPARLWSADFLRTAAIGLIAWYHIWQQSWLNPGFWIGHTYINLQQIVRNGYLMVDVLLVLSGFLLALPFCKKDSDISPLVFYRRRFFRIYPGYILILLIPLVFQILPQGLYSSAGECITDLLAHLTFTQNLFYNTYFSTPFTGVLWTLAVEIQFYLVFPLIAYFYRRYPFRTCLALCCAAWVWRACIYNRSDLYIQVNQLPAMLDTFALGMAAARLYTVLQKKTYGRRTCVILALLCSFSFLCILQMIYRQTLGDQDTIHRAQLVLRLPLSAAAAAFLLLGSLLPEKAGRIPGNRVTVFLAGISYNFYLWHQYIALQLKQWHIPAYTGEAPNQTGEQPWQLRYTLCCFIFTFILAVILTYLVEKPFIKLAHKTKPLS